jgi:hypothetical protein
VLGGWLAERFGLTFALHADAIALCLMAAFVLVRYPRSIGAAS